MPSPLDAMAAWHAAVQELGRLADRQVRTLQDGEGITAILAEKELAYQAANAAAQRVLNIGSADDAATDALRDAIRAGLEAVAGAEEESRALCRARLRRLQEDLDGAARRRRLGATYTAPPPSGGPRFLDQRG